MRLVIDAEQTYLQAPINHMVLALQYKYNRNHPWIYNTYQCYRKVDNKIMRSSFDKETTPVQVFVACAVSKVMVSLYM